MTCDCALCAPWNKAAEGVSDTNRLNELTRERLATHGLTPVERHDRLLATDPGYAARAVCPEGRNCAAQARCCRAHLERRFPPPRQYGYSTPFMRAVCKEQEEARLREYLRRHMERARDGHERTAGTRPDAAAD